MKEKLDIIINKIKEETRKTCYSFDIVDSKAGITDTKLGGYPYLPKGDSYPVDESGNPLALLFQLNFQDIDLEDYPKEGILQLFIGNSLNYPTQYKVLYHNKIEENMETKYPKIDFSCCMVCQEYKIEVKKMVTYMPINDYRFDSILSRIAKEECGLKVNNLYSIEDDLQDKDAFDYIVERIPVTYSEIGGYANFTQFDPREGTDSRLTECIFKLDSYLDLNKIRIGDCGIAWLLISKDDLKHKRFEGAQFDWDCL